MAHIPAKMLSNLMSFSNDAAHKRRAVGVGLLRIQFGLLTAVYFALHLRQRHLVWGPNGMLLTTDALRLNTEAHAWTLYHLLPSAAGAEFLYWASLFAAFALMIGLWPNVVKWPWFVLTWSAYQRNNYAIDGGDNLLIILSIYLLFADVSRVSVAPSVFRKRYLSTSWVWLRGVLHNGAVAACLAQVAVLYFISAFFKLRGHVWVNGTAIYYILRSNTFSLPGWTDHIILSPVLVVVGTYGTIFFELAYAWLVWQYSYRYIITGGAILLHAGIALFMGLPWFSLTMISVHVLLFRDSDYAALGIWWTRFRQVPNRLGLRLESIS